MGEDLADPHSQEWLSHGWQPPEVHDASCHNKTRRVETWAALKDRPHKIGANRSRRRSAG